MCTQRLSCSYQLLLIHTVLQPEVRRCKSSSDCSPDRSMGMAKAFELPDAQHESPNATRCDDGTDESEQTDCRVRGSSSALSLISLLQDSADLDDFLSSDGASGASGYSTPSTSMKDFAFSFTDSYPSDSMEDVVLTLQRFETRFGS